MSLSSAIYGNAVHWDVHRPDHGAFIANLGGGSAANRSDTATAVLNLAARSPTVVAACIDRASTGSARSEQLRTRGLQLVGGETRPFTRADSQPRWVDACSGPRVWVPSRWSPVPCAGKAHTGPSQGGRGGLKNYSLAYRRVGSSNCEPFCGLLLLDLLSRIRSMAGWFLPFKFYVLW